MICPECAKNNRCSCVECYSIDANDLVNPYNFVDESGAEHSHVWDHCITDCYRCSNGHYFRITRPIRPCPACGTEFAMSKSEK